MLNFFYGSELEPLARRLCAEMKDNLPENPLAPEIFVVQNHGIGQWLSLYLADQEEGIAANMEFEFPSERIWKLIRSIDDDIPKDLPSDRGPMTWSLVELFEDEQLLDQFPNLRRYISDPDPEQRAMRSWKLASKIADVFDQYLIYRPDMINHWEQKKLATGSVDAEGWQMQLWNRLTNHWKDYYDGKWLHRAELQQQLIRHIENGTLDTQELPVRITIFGVSTASPAFIETMVKLSKLTEVYFYHLTIDPDKKESDAFVNPLLQSLSAEGTGFMKQFSAAVRSDAVIKKEVNWEEVTTTDEPRQSVITAIQSDLKEDSPLLGPKLKVPAADRSVQVHSCHSPMREVEVLYDQLLSLFDRQPDLNPDDVLIMTPDIETYAPMIEAVFGTPDEGQPAIPYAIADRGIEGERPAIEAFQKILELSESRFKITEVLDLLDSDPIQEAFGYGEEELNRLEQWIRDNNIRWGIDGSSKADMGLPPSNHFTWQAGLQRILLGYMMRSSDDELYQHIYAYGEVESSDDAALAGTFSRLLNQLFECNKRCREARSPEQWQHQLESLVDRFLPDNRDYFREIARIRDAISGLTEETELGGCNKQIPFAIVRRWLADQLEEKTTGGGRIGRGVTFSSLMPMRSIPFEVIGMIGLNEGSFPRSKIPIEFDLMHLDPQPGDPVQSEEDRYLFLENLLSVRSTLYFSFVGQSNRQDAEFPPSVVLKEFLDHLQEHYGLRPEDMLTKHRLQPFSPRYFEGEQHFSYSKSQLELSRSLANGEENGTAFFEEGLGEAEAEWKQLSVNDLISFFQHPAEYLLRNRLGIYLRDEDIITEDREPFALDKLAEYNVGQPLLQRFLKEQSLESYEQVMRSRDMLPEGWTGEQAFRQKAREVEEFGTEIQQRLDEQPLADLELSLDIGDFRITGTLTDIYRGARMEYRFGKARPKDKVGWWIRHLLFQQRKPADHPGNSMLFSWNEGSFEEHRLSPVSESENLLVQLLDYYWQGLQQPLPIFCKSSYAYAKAVLQDDKEEDEGIAKAVSKWEPGWGGYPGEGDDPYNKLVTEGEHPFEEQEFVEYSRSLWAPYFEAIIEEEG
ncbi:exodeoxyribonuclease V subunit gamma [Fodinibius halophilus]|uniref:Exodeoxyribonuclease V subunit gamma n=1 Tax=Fodinibius halophilus TaxID=1736908 RepID=A0A6M1T457_9BACT|nr:exodeoxyribonuclease V subunit gamma [Fodinibius halophilus]NGP88015.1 exodeoxyribonuclease V subunit gamma [Fodinibius halophilus]